MPLSTFTAFSHWNKFGHFVEGNVEVGQRRPGLYIQVSSILIRMGVDLVA